MKYALLVTLILMVSCSTQNDLYVLKGEGVVIGLAGMGDPVTKI